jgi:hypothetical protein
MEHACPWGAFGRAEDVGCEPDLCAWIVHPAETWSNLAYFAVAAFLIVRYGRTDRHLPVAWLPWIVVAIGIGSAAFHASTVAWLHAADVAAIYLLTGFFLATYLQHNGLLGPGRFRAAFVALVGAGAVLASIDPVLGYFGIAAQGVAIVWLAWRLPIHGPRRELVAAIVLNQAAAAALWLDKSQVACARGAFVHIVQPHSFWHVLSAVSLLFFYRYQRQVDRAALGTTAASVAPPRCDSVG